MTVRSQRRELTGEARRAGYCRQAPRLLELLSTGLGGCPCGAIACGGAGDFPLAARFLPGWDECVPSEVRAVHDIHTARVLTLWKTLTWGPQAELARLARPAWLAVVRLWRQLEVLGVLSPLPPGPLPVGGRWLEACPSHGPPALSACPAAGMTAPEALVIPP
jgi:hypothetical protein